MIDHFDSFTYLIEHLLLSCRIPVEVIRYDRLNLEELESRRPSHIVLSPGPGHPSSKSVSKDLVTRFAGRIPILGICLGHQILGDLYGGTTVRADMVMHGKASSIEHNRSGLFVGLKSPFHVGRYHSLMLQDKSMPECLRVTARSKDAIMAIEHRTIPALVGVQFHPESFLSENGQRIAQNFITMSERFPEKGFSLQ